MTPIGHRFYLDLNVDERSSAQELGSFGDQVRDMSCGRAIPDSGDESKVNKNPFTHRCVVLPHVSTLFRQSPERDKSPPA